MNSEIHYRKGKKAQEIGEDIRERLEETMPQEAQDLWLRKFRLEHVSRDKISYLYTGDRDLEEFENTYRTQMYLEICDYFGRPVGLDVHKEQILVPKEPKEEKHGHVGTGKRVLFLVLSLAMLCLALLIFVGVGSYLDTRNFTERFYSVGSPKIEGDVRILHLTDLHSVEYGGGNSRLLDRMEKLKPDLIVMTGDMVDTRAPSQDNVVEFCGKAAEIAPVYFIYGNNETQRTFPCPMTRKDLDEMLGFDDDNRDPSVLMEREDPLRTALTEAGVHVLMNQMETLTVGKNQLDIYGVLTSNPSAYWPYTKDTLTPFLYEDEDHYKIMAIHEPLMIELSLDGDWGDLVLAGDTHGGIIRLPILGGVYERGRGFFPERRGGMIYGMYKAGDAAVEVSSGLINSGPVRVNNPPELVIVDLSQY